MVERDAPELVQVGAQRIGEHVGVQTVVLGARDAVPVAKAVELFRVERVDVEATLEERLDQRTPRHFDSDRDGFGSATHVSEQRFEEGVDGRCVVFDRPLQEHRAFGREDAHLVRLGGPVDADQQFVGCAHRPSAACGDPAGRVQRRPCTGARSANSPLDVRSAASPGRRSPPGGSKHRGHMGTPGKVAGWISRHPNVPCRVR